MTAEQAAAILAAIDALAADVAGLRDEMGKAPSHACYPLPDLPTAAELVSVK